MPLVESVLCQQCQNCPSAERNEVRPQLGGGTTLSATVSRYRTNEASSEGEASDGYDDDDDDDDDETTIDDHQSKSEDTSEDWSSSAAFDEEHPVSGTADDVTTSLPERVTEEGRRAPPTAESPSSHSIMNSKPSVDKTSLPSLLRKNTQKRRGVSRRRVRGLWGSHEGDPFALLHDDLLQRTLSYLSLADTCTMSMVSKRWNYMATREATFQMVDATEFVERAFSNFSTKLDRSKAARETAQALSNALENHTPRSLTIRNIGEKICPDTYLPSLKGLQHLKLDRFKNLTDTHIHVWMLSSTAGGQGRLKDIHLRTLALENCPKLSNGTVKCIARHCPALKSLSLAGDERVEDLSELSSLWRVEGQQTLPNMQHSSSNITLSTSSLRSMDDTSLFPGLPATDGSTPTPRLLPTWKGNTNKKVGSPNLGQASHKQLLRDGNMSSIFNQPDAAKVGSFFAPPKHPRSSSSQQSDSSAVERASSHFSPPAKTATNEKLSNPLSGMFAPPALAPKASSSSMSGLFLPPKAAQPSLSGLFAPTAKTSVSSSHPSKAKNLPPALFACPDTNPATLLTSMFKPPTTDSSLRSQQSCTRKPPGNSSSPPSTLSEHLDDPPRQQAANPANSSSSHLLGMFTPPQACGSPPSSQTQPQNPYTAQSKSMPGIFVPSAANQQNHLRNNVLTDLFAAPVESAPSQPTNGLFAPPATPEPSPAGIEDIHTTQDRHEPNGLFAPPPKGHSSTPTNTPTGLFVPPSNPDLEPPSSPSKNPGAGLESLFRPPGNSPSAFPQAPNRSTTHRHCSSQSMPAPGHLDRINISGTAVKPKTILTSLQHASGRVVLTSLECKGTGQVWSEDEVRELTEVVSFAKLRLLDLEYEGPIVADVMSRYPSSDDLPVFD